MELRDEIGGSKDLIQYRIETAEEDLGVAIEFLDNEQFRFANNRAYYAMFHAITAIHALDRRKYKKHKDAIANFNKNYIHTGLFPKEYGRKLSDAELVRHASDYDDFYIASKDETEELIQTATELIELIKAYIEERIH